MKAIKIILILIIITTAVSGFEIAANNRGFELGLNGKRDFKMLNAFEGYFTRKSEWFTMRSFKFTTSLQWLKLGKDAFNVNFLSGLYLSYSYYNENNSESYDYRSLKLGANIADIETELKINQTGSFFIRVNLMNFSAREHFSFGVFAPRKVFKDEIDRLVFFGIRLRFSRSEKNVL